MSSIPSNEGCAVSYIDNRRKYRHTSPANDRWEYAPAIGKDILYSYYPEKFPAFVQRIHRHTEILEYSKGAHFGRYKEKSTVGICIVKRGPVGKEILHHTP